MRGKPFVDKRFPSPAPPPFQKTLLRSGWPVPVADQREGTSFPYRERSPVEGRMVVGDR